LSFAILEVNGTGASCDTTANVSEITLSGKSAWANLTWLVPNACEGKAIGWKQWANDSTVNANLTSTQVYEVQNVNPETLFGTNPVDTYNSTSNSVTFEFKVSDNLNVDALRLYGNWTGTWTINQTNMTAVNDSYWNITVTGIPDGKDHVWAGWGNDTLGNFDFTDANRTFTIDSVAPIVTLPVYTNGTIKKNTDTLILNISVIDATTTPQICLIDVTGTNQTITYSSGWCNGTISLSGLTDGDQVLGIWANDSLNNFGFNNSYVVYIDTTPPTVTLPVYENATKYRDTDSLIFNISVSDSGSGASYCDINVAGNSNQTVAVSSGWCNGTYSLSGVADGNQTINVYANDTAGNLALNNSYVVQLDSTNPAIEYTTGTPANNANLNQDYIFVNVTASDPSFSNITYTLFNSTSPVNVTTYTTLITSINWTSLPDETYTYNVTIVDLFLNTNSTPTRTVSLDTVFPQFTNHQRSPTTPNEDQSVQINVTVTEQNKDTVLLEFNNGTAKNYTVTTSVGDEFFFTINTGNYTAHDSITYYWYANDTTGNLNKSAQQSFTVTNQVPSVSAPSINTTTPFTNDLISCDGGTFSDNDAEDPEVSRFFIWYDDDAPISGQNSQTLSLTVSGLDKGDVIKCSVNVYDGFDNSSFVNSSNSATIQNSPPVITNPLTTISWNANGSTFTYDYQYTDADGDSEIWYDNTTLFDINQTGYISDTPTEGEAGVYEIRINVSDGTVNTTDDFTYTINDVIIPQIQFVSPTENNATSVNRTWIFANVSITEANFKNVTFKLFNSTGQLNITTYTTSAREINWTGLLNTNVQYWYNVSTFDTSSNFNETETRYITLNPIPPPAASYRLSVGSGNNRISFSSGGSRLSFRN